MHACSNALYPKDRAVVQLPQLVSKILSAEVRIPTFDRKMKVELFPRRLKAVVIATTISLRPNPTEVLSSVYERPIVSWIYAMLLLA